MRINFTQASISSQMRKVNPQISNKVKDNNLVAESGKLQATLAVPFATAAEALPRV